MQIQCNNQMINDIIERNINGRKVKQNLRILANINETLFDYMKIKATNENVSNPRTLKIANVYV